MWKMILADGTELAGFQQNGNNYFREDKVDETSLAGNLSTLTLTDGEETIVLRNAELVQQVHYEGVPGLEDGWYLCFREKTQQELMAEALRDTDAMSVDHEYRITLMELGIAEGGEA